MDLYSITDARKKLGELVKQAKYGRKIIALGQHGKPEVCLVAYDLAEKMLPVSKINGMSAFDFLEKEPDLYSRDDLKKE